ncbi:MAG: M48 family metalloprotease [Candidatus Nitrospinota bacterium M3_3B_026]
MRKAPCPRCGYENRVSAIQCGLCRAILKAEGKRAERAKRRTEKRSSFFAEQAANRRNSNILLLALTGLLTGLGAIAGHLYGFPLEGAVIAFIIASTLGAFSWFSGARLVLSMSGAKKISHDGHPTLFNIVEEMKVASGLPMPEVYIIESAAPNAFATGRDPDRAAVAVTRGLLEKLNRDELQGVIAHEMSHVRNYDIRYAMLAGVIVGATALIADAFLRGVFWRGGGRKGGHPAMLAVALIFAVLAPISAKILQMAISRRRELLADASAVQLTRNPDGLASALYKIWNDQEPLEATNRATQHMYIVNPVKNFTMKSKALFSTHPPMEARLKALKSMGAMGDYGV